MLGEDPDAGFFTIAVVVPFTLFLPEKEIFLMLVLLFALFCAVLQGARRGIGDHCLSCGSLLTIGTHNRHLLRSLTGRRSPTSQDAAVAWAAPIAVILLASLLWPLKLRATPRRILAASFLTACSFGGLVLSVTLIIPNLSGATHALISASGLIMLACTLLSLYLLEALSGRLGRIRGAVTGEPGC